MIRVLIVDDSSTIRVALEQALRAESDMEVVGALGTGEEALEAIPHLNPDVTVMDIMMPGISGIDATRQISEISPAPVIIMSTRSEHELLQQAMQAGASEYLIKPFQFEDVAIAIRRVHALNRKRASYEVESASQTYAPEVFAIFSAKGGVGKSQIAINLASSIRRA